MKNVIVISAKLNGEDTTRKDQEILNLVESLDMNAIRFYTQEIKEINKATYIGSGKVEEIATYMRALEAEAVVCNFDLTPLQFRNLKDGFKCEVYDRTGIILQIFAMRAKTREAKLQVEVATLQYLKARLVEHDANFSQVTSGGGTHNKGSGEKQIDLDRAKYRVMLAAKNRELAELARKRENNRKRRNASDLPVIAIVGYTNAGKSTLLNDFIEANKNSGGEKKVLQEDRLFATLETSTRYIDLTEYPSFLLIDTVGFIDNLPTTLVKAFRSTLEEICEADLLIQVEDVSDSGYEQQIRTTNETLKEIGVSEEIPMIYLYNKTDKIDHYPFIPNEDSIYVSLKDTTDILEITKLIFTKLTKGWKKIHIHMDYSENLYAFKKQALVLSVEEKDDGYEITAIANNKTIELYKNYNLTFLE